MIKEQLNEEADEDRKFGNWTWRFHKRRTSAMRMLRKLKKDAKRSRTGG